MTDPLPNEWKPAISSNLNDRAPSKGGVYTLWTAMDAGDKTRLLVSSIQGNLAWP
ncbi:MAG: hypothetical protein OXN84_01645 [Albidovulum sp.]|nr:hypothetical protein [Albidovulum sp.]